MEVIILSCPFCAAQITKRSNVCEYCDREYHITSFSYASSLNDSDLNKYMRSYSSSLKEAPSNPDLNMAMGMCHLRLQAYDKAYSHFEKAVDGDISNSEAYFLASVSILRGKKAFVNSKSDIDKAIEYLNTACILENKPTYRLMLAYLKFDYYMRKCLNVHPDYRSELHSAFDLGLTESEINDTFELLKVERPDGFQ